MSLLHSYIDTVTSPCSTAKKQLPEYNFQEFYVEMFWSSLICLYS